MSTMPGTFSDPSRALSLSSALVGTGLWLVTLAWLRPEWGVALVLLASFVVVPLGLALNLGMEPRMTRSWTGGLALGLLLPAAIARTYAFTKEPGLTAALLALPWLAVTGLVAVCGHQRLRARGWAAPEDVCADVGQVFLAVGGGWVLLSRGGVQPMGFREPIILLTGAHFHYAGFALPLLVGLAGQLLRDHTARLASIAVMIGVPLVALGITLAPHGIRAVEWLASWLMAAAGLLVAVLQLRLAWRAQRAIPRFLFVLSGLALAFGMVLAAIYALGTYCGRAWLAIPDMLPWHGAVNALGFALPGLLAWLGRPRSQA